MAAMAEVAVPVAWLAVEALVQGLLLLAPTVLTATVAMVGMVGMVSHRPYLVKRVVTAATAVLVALLLERGAAAMAAMLV